MKQVVVVIPIYKEKLKLSEKAALEQVRNILGRYDICFMAPERMRGYLESKGERAEYWADECFANVRAYSHLLLTDEVYNRFADYEYMLIYQLDAFVFSDRLLEFCSLGYDYIGAPMSYWSSWRNVPTKVGNGGFSLRRIDACKRVVAVKAEVYDRTGRGQEFELAEDKFFGYCGYDEQIAFSTPDTETALAFAVEYDVMRIYGKLSEGNLPFGCHAWPKAWYWRIWEPFVRPRVANWMIIREQELEKLPLVSYREFRRRALTRYLVRRLCRRGEISEKAIGSIIPGGIDCVLWGSGEIGSRAKVLLKRCGRHVRCFIDSQKRLTEIDGIEVLPPEKLSEVVSGSKVIVSVTKDKYVKEITSSLERMGLAAGKDYVTYDEMISCLANYYCAGVETNG